MFFRRLPFGSSAARCFAVILLFLFGKTGPLAAYPPLFSVKKVITSTEVVGGDGHIVVTGLTSTGGVTGYVAYSVKTRGQTIPYVQGYYWDDAAQTLTNFDGDTLGAASSMANCVNGSGAVAGVYWTVGDDTQQLGFVWQPDGTITTFQSPNEGDIDSVLAINASGQVIGTYFGAYGYNRGFLWDGNVCTDLGDLGNPANSFVWPQAINNAGQVIGTVYTTDASHPRNAPVPAAFQWQNGSMGKLDSADNYVQTFGLGLNDAGEMIGNSLSISPDLSTQLVPGGFTGLATR